MVITSKKLPHFSDRWHSVLSVDMVHSLSLPAIVILLHDPIFTLYFVLHFVLLLFYLILSSYYSCFFILPNTKFIIYMLLHMNFNALMQVNFLSPEIF